MTVLSSRGRWPVVLLVAAATTLMPSTGASAACQPSPATLTIADDQVTGGERLSGSITLTCAARGSGLSVSLSSSSTAVAVPTNATFLPGQSQAGFPITTTPVTT